MKEKLRLLAVAYATPDEFKAGNHAKWAIAKSKGWLREFFPDHSEPVPVYDIPEPEKLRETQSDAKLRDAIDDYLVNLRIRKANKTLRSKIPVNKVISDIEYLLNNY